MRFKLTITLVIANVILFGWIFWLERQADVRKSLTDEQKMVLPAGVVETAETITLEGPNLDTPWQLQKQGKDWQLVSPVNWKANTFAVSRIISQLQFLDWEAQFPIEDIEAAGQELADYGLDNPAVVMTLDGASGQTRLKIGTGTAVGQRMYILSPTEDRVFVVPRSLLDSLALDLAQLRSPEIFDIMIFDIQGINVAGDSRTALIKMGDKDWRFQLPIQAQADPRAVDGALAGLTGMKIISFVEEGAVQTGLQTSTTRIQLEGKSSRQTLIIGDATNTAWGPGYFARIEGKDTAFIVPGDPVDLLLGAQLTLREKRIFQIGENANISSIRLTISDETLDLQRLETGEWQVLENDSEKGMRTLPADPEIMRQTMLALNALEAVEFHSDAPSDADLIQYGFDDPQRRITVKNGTSRTLLVGQLNAETGMLYAKSDDARFVYLIEPDLLHFLPVGHMYYRNRTIDALPESTRLIELQVIDMISGSPLLDIGPDDTHALRWDDVFNKDGDQELQALAKTLSAYIMRFHIKLYISETFTPDGFRHNDIESPWAYRMRGRVMLPGANSDESLDVDYYFTERLGGSTQYGGSPAQNLMFAIDQKLIDSLAGFPAKLPDTDAVLDNAADAPGALPVPQKTVNGVTTKEAPEADASGNPTLENAPAAPALQ